MIVGYRRTSKLVAAIIFACALCQVSAGQRLFRVRTWFTFFFLPIFPFGHGSYVMQCAHCGRTTNLAREGADRFIADATALAAAHAAQQAGAVAPAGEAQEILAGASPAAQADTDAIIEETTERPQR